MLQGWCDRAPGHFAWQFAISYGSVMGQSIHEIPLQPVVLKWAKSFMYDSVSDRQFDVDAPAEPRTPVVWKEKLAHWLEVQERWHQIYPAASKAACNVACWMRADFLFLMNSEEARCG